MMTPAPDSVGDFERFDHVAGSGAFQGRSYQVLARGPGSGAPVVVMHELFGLSPANLALCRFLSDDPNGFRVYAPVLFGTPGRKSLLGAARSKICLRREFTFFLTGRTSPVVEWLREFTSFISGRHEGRSVGVIGMCMTGGFALAMVAEPHIGAAVASQPSLPLPVFRGLLPRVQSDLGIDGGTRGAVTRSQTPLMLLRYEDDWRCPEPRASAYVDAYGPSAEPVDTADPSVRATRGPRLATVTLAGGGHSVLAEDLNEEARRLVARWLTAALGSGSGPAR